MTVAVYGATGFTGKLVAGELAARGVPMILAGRDAEKLGDVAAAVGEHVTGIAVAGLDDHAALVRAFEGATVVANCAGPFVRTGAPVVRAAVEAGVHYLDTTGEQQWMRRCFDEFADARVAVIPAMGFDYVPGDLLCHIVGNECAPLDHMLVAYHVLGFDMTRGTLRSSLESLRGGDVFWRGGRHVEADAGIARAYVRFPQPIGRKRMGKYPGGEVLTVPRHVDVRDITSLIAAETVAPEALAPITLRLMPRLARLMDTPLAPRIDAAIGKLPEGPPPDKRAGVRWTIACVADGADGRRARGTVSGGDIYGLTRHTIAEGAIRMSAPDFTATGPVAPAEAFDARDFLAALQPHGVTWQFD